MNLNNESIILVVFTSLQKPCSTSHHKFY